jgi:hypothetical protein
MSQPPGMLPRPPRLFEADEILNGQVRLDGYPFRHIALSVRRHAGNQAIDVLLSAVEMLDPLGWDLVNITHDDSFRYIAFLRTRS